MLSIAAATAESTCRALIREFGEWNSRVGKSRRYYKYVAATVATLAGAATTETNPITVAIPMGAVSDHVSEPPGWRRLADMPVGSTAS